VGKKITSITKNQLPNLTGKNNDLLKTVEDNTGSGSVLMKKYWSFSVLFTRQ
jgi:hypothetical protein